MSSIEEFLDAVAARTGFPRDEVTAQTRIWTDLKLFGGEYVDVMMSVQKLLGVRLETSIDVFQFIPRDREVGWFQSLRTKREIPDLTLGELFSQCEMKGTI